MNVAREFVPLDENHTNEYDGDKPVSMEAWDIIMGNNHVEKTSQAIQESTGSTLKDPTLLYGAAPVDNVPDISKIQVPSSFFGEQVKEDKPITNRKSVMITEEELKVLVAAKQIISKLLEMTTCGTIGVNMASTSKTVKMNAPKKVQTKESRLKPKLKFEKKKKTLMEILRNDK